MTSPIAAVEVESQSVGTQKGESAASLVGNVVHLTKRAVAWQVISIPIFVVASFYIAEESQYSPSVPPVFSGKIGVAGLIWLAAVSTFGEGALQFFLAMSVWLANRAPGPDVEFKDEMLLSHKWDSDTRWQVPVFSLICHWIACTFVVVCRLLMFCYCIRAPSLGVYLVMAFGFLLTVLWVFTVVTWKQPLLSVNLLAFALAPVFCAIGFFWAAWSPRDGLPSEALVLCGLGQLMYVMVLGSSLCGFKRWHAEVVNILAWLVFALGAMML